MEIQNTELNKHLSNDRVFNEINKSFISLQDNEVKRTNIYLKQVITTLIKDMKLQDSLFKKMYQEIIFCGSFYKGTKVGKPNEFDLNIILQLPINYKYINLYSERPAFIQINVEDSYNVSTYNHLSDAEKRLFGKLISQGHLNPNKFRSWIEGIITKVITELPGHKLSVQDDTFSFNALIKIKKSGPAFTVILDIPNEFDIHIDLAPALAFNTSTIHEFTTKFRELENYRNKSCFVIPVPLVDKDSNTTTDLHWRLSFSLQENELLTKYGRVKPIIRQMKKLRDIQQWKRIASYYIETIFLNKLTEMEDDFNKMPLTLFFFIMLKELYYACKKHEIKYFWDEKYNLLAKIEYFPMLNITCRLSNIITDIEKNIATNSFVLAKYILTSNELQLLQRILEENNVQYTEDENETQPEKSSCTLL